MKTIIAIIIAVVLVAPVSSAQLTYDMVRVAVPAGMVCPADWTAETETIVTEERFYVRAPVVLGGRIFLVSSSYVNLVWSTDASRAAAVVSGVLDIQAESSSTKNFCSLLP